MGIRGLYHYIDKKVPRVDTVDPANLAPSPYQLEIDLMGSYFAFIMRSMTENYIPSSTVTTGPPSSATTTGRALATMLISTFSLRTPTAPHNTVRHVIHVDGAYNLEKAIEHKERDAARTRQDTKLQAALT
ncbi:hypothetical protein BGZ98_006891, partial [Dissophora globulifera]